MLVGIFPAISGPFTNLLGKLRKPAYGEPYAQFIYIFSFKIFGTNTAGMISVILNGRMKDSIIL